MTAPSLSEVGGVELGQGLYTKVKQMTSFGLGQLCLDGGECLLDKVRVIQADSLSLIQGGFTGGSTTSGNSCEAVRHSCATLVERLKPIRESLEAKAGTVEWSALIAQVTISPYESNSVSDMLITIKRELTIWMLQSFMAFAGRYGECKLISACILVS
jgi:CO/xanthine dehydrogenase Mo-binding subunit